VKKIAEKFNRLSRVHQRHRQQTTDGRLIAYSERNVVCSLKNKKTTIQRKKSHTMSESSLGAGSLRHFFTAVFLFRNNKCHN